MICLLVGRRVGVGGVDKTGLAEFAALDNK